MVFFVVSTEEWTWVSGPATGNLNGVYGSLGQASSSTMPGGREDGCAWMSPAGNICIFGGFGLPATGAPSRLNDFWEYSVSGDVWTWKGGANFFEQNGNYGTMGGFSSTNMPGARAGAVCWTDLTGDFWLFGGSGRPATGSSGLLSDLWKFDYNQQQWVWVKGSTSINSTAVYGVYQQPAFTNNPGARVNSCSWVDQANGDFYLFGGLGYDNTNVGLLNDIWRYSETTDEWTWMKGSSTIGQPGIYGTLGQTSTANIPGARWSPMAWSGLGSSFFLFGGDVSGNGSTELYMNDLWSSGAGSTVGLKRLETSSDASVFPNPVSEQLTIRTSLKELVNFVIEDVCGREVSSASFTGTTNVDISNLAGGVYMVKIKSSAGVRTQKVIVDH